MDVDRVILLNPDDPPLFVARLGSRVTLPVPGASRDVRIVHERYAHIIERRLQDGDEQVALALRRMAAVIAAPTHLGKRTEDGRRIELYRRWTEDPSGICVGIKFVNAEAWVSTAFPLGLRSLLREVRKGRFTPLADDDAQRTLFGLPSKY